MLFIQLSGKTIYSRNKSSWFPETVQVSKQALCCFSPPRRSNHRQCCVALHNYSQQMISVFLSLHQSSDRAAQLAFVAAPTPRRGYQSWFARIKVGETRADLRGRIDFFFFFSLLVRSIYRVGRGRNELIQGKQNTMACLWRKLNDTQICRVRGKLVLSFTPQHGAQPLMVVRAKAMHYK